MEILGNTLGEIAEEKAGILKRGVPAYTVAQPKEAMSVLEDKASELNVSLGIAAPLSASDMDGLQLGLSGGHQFVNAGLAVALCRTWIQRMGHGGRFCLDVSTSLPEQFKVGLVAANIEGRAQTIPDVYLQMQRRINSGDTTAESGELVFYLDGAHSPESMEGCGRWFSQAINKPIPNLELFCVSSDPQKEDQKFNPEVLDRKFIQILLFYCLPVRDPERLLPVLIKTCALQGVHFSKVLFVSTLSALNKFGTAKSSTAVPSEADLSWLLSLQTVWDQLTSVGSVDSSAKVDDPIKDEGDLENVFSSGNQNSAVFASPSLALRWLRNTVQKDTSLCVQVLVTGSLYLVGDLLKLVKYTP